MDQFFPQKFCHLFSMNVSKFAHAAGEEHPVSLCHEWEWVSTLGGRSYIRISPRPVTRNLNCLLNLQNHETAWIRCAVNIWRAIYPVKALNALWILWNLFTVKRLCTLPSLFSLSEELSSPIIPAWTLPINTEQSKLLCEFHTWMHICFMYKKVCKPCRIYWWNHGAMGLLVMIKQRIQHIMYLEMLRLRFDQDLSMRRLM